MLRLLLIEDNEDDSLLIREMPESAKGDDFRIDWADRLSEGLARLQEAEFDASCWTSPCPIAGDWILW